MLKELSNEEVVTKILLSNEILRKVDTKAFVTNPNFDLTNFLANKIEDVSNNLKSTTISKYQFIK